MQTNFPYGINDLPLISKLRTSQLKKAYRVTYRSAHTGKEDFVGAHDEEEAEKKRREIENLGHKVQHVKVLKSKVYVKTPSDAPQGVKVQEGKRGGHYYESSQQFIISHEVKEVDSNEFEQVKSQVPQNMRHFLSTYTPEQMKQKGIRTYLTTNKTAGVALNGDEIINLFSLKPGEGKKALIEAIRNGGRRLDCFDKRKDESYGLPDYYSKFGFKEYKREKNWTPGEPDVVYMRLE